ncbi:fumarylacetoacetase [Marinigracilibium pacificum]|uniref:fumarylacetoacetase n=1 Tax=Marinigracilibium pacificum TaxID=2729599 RepID=A0A848J2N9_9BACT|nr:fumarylacetoacetase [Marinigracilibium pacificum]NMM48589.1 fumarylacetoacetase [Marinigracilibium pacificum]
MSKANDPKLKSWVSVPENSDFPIQNLPFGIFSTSYLNKRVGVAIGNNIIDMDYLLVNDFFKGIELPSEVFTQPYLNDFISLGKKTTNAVRERLSEILQEDNPELRDSEEMRERALIPMEDATMQMPVKVGDYTDFYSSIEHATNIGTMIRDPENALMPNWRHLPVGYHGRSSTIIPSGIPIQRPLGQTKAPDAENPTFGPTKRLDFELEMAFITGKATQIGDSVNINEADDYIFGMVVFNDWSARDIQVWEYQPLGPFLAKNFASSISPWIVTIEALEPFRVAQPKQDPEVLPYLQSKGDNNFDINLEVDIKPENSEAVTVCRSNHKYLYWNIKQQLAHQTINGCSINVGDMYASGTISGPTEDSYGSMMELSWKGTKPVKMKDGTERVFLHDGDTVTMRGWSEKDGVRVGFGEVTAKILPAREQ